MGQVYRATDTKLKRQVAIYGLEESGGMTALVMELVEQGIIHRRPEARDDDDVVVLAVHGPQDRRYGASRRGCGSAATPPARSETVPASRPPG